jgi:HPt (histidine-containing phosphotransfer) domain-containing protein
MSAPVPVFNLAQLSEISGGDRKYELEILTEFLDQAEVQIADLRRAIEAGDAVAIGRTAHTLKGGSGTLGAEAVAAASGELEAIGESGDLSRAADALERAADALAATHAWLDEYFGRQRRAA